MMAICFWEATFIYKSYHLSDCYQLYMYISCKNNIRKGLNYQIDLSDWYQLYISCEINIETPITLSNRYETIRSIFLQLMTVIVATIPSGIDVPCKEKWKVFFYEIKGMEAMEAHFFAQE